MLLTSVTLPLRNARHVLHPHRCSKSMGAKIMKIGQPERGFVEPGGSSVATPRRREGNFYLPAATASWRLRLLRTADMSDAAIASIK